MVLAATVDCQESMRTFFQISQVQVGAQHGAHPGRIEVITGPMFSGKSEEPPRTDNED